LRKNTGIGMIWGGFKKKVGGRKELLGSIGSWGKRAQLKGTARGS